jgi:hypothetical protein
VVAAVEEEVPLAVVAVAAVEEAAAGKAPNKNAAVSDKKLRHF